MKRRQNQAYHSHAWEKETKTEGESKTRRRQGHLEDKHQDPGHLESGTDNQEMDRGPRMAKDPAQREKDR